MAKNYSLIKVKGSLDGLTFYKTQDGSLVRMRGGVSASRIANDPVFARTRENMSEFGHSANAGKLLRSTLRSVMVKCADSRVTSRLTQAMARVKNYDLTSARGERLVSVGLVEPEGKQVLRGFDLNLRAPLSSVLLVGFTFDPITGTIDIPNFSPLDQVAYLPSTTHLSLTSINALVDFEAGSGEMATSPALNLPISPTVTDVTLTPAAAPSGAGFRFYLLMVEFFQEVNGVQYSLRNGAYNALTIIDVA